MKYSYEMMSRLLGILSEQSALIKYLVDVIWQIDCTDELKRDAENMLQTTLTNLTDTLSGGP